MNFSNFLIFLKFRPRGVFGVTDHEYDISFSIQDVFTQDIGNMYQENVNMC
jgi:hypothetical protein